MREARASEAAANGGAELEHRFRALADPLRVRNTERAGVAPGPFGGTSDCAKGVYAVAAFVGA